MKKIIELIKEYFGYEGQLIKQFLGLQGRFWVEIGSLFLGWVVNIKDGTAKLMYKQRGRFSQSFVSTSLAILSFGAVVFSGNLEDLIKRGSNSEVGGSGYLIMAADSGTGGAETLISDLPKGETTEYRVVEGDTISSIAQKFGVSIDTVLWENNLKSVEAIKPKQILRILPVTGVRHQVKRGETVYSIAKYYSVDAQNIIDYPFNTFSNDEIFALTAGQELIIPEGIEPKETITGTRSIARTVAPIPGVVGEGNYMWPTSGTITQRSSWYHRAVDIANRGNPAIVAAATGTVVTAGWNGGGYGNYVVIDHGNGQSTLYAHMSNNSIVVKAGDKVSQGQKIGTMGSTGRSTGTHLHFEIVAGGAKLDPLKMLK
ncbi:MAG: Peptidase M23 family protein [Candidatus Shapirobacteria bacterium GW2011_GWE1_38_10]|uniref:Peptidase M23 family protein n=1 Tax=Candidatus Shapirobacteria bacterium GW2011_GWE1_38_10 TaxID=1618488 RepID=A0A0G0IEK7_9BACT|nr:MAG: Peptidase M23 family protein [Candidatus Shapirobacteria bacterium GW2011_GWF2_37_20]KKQ49435.1 MAG: Peptidase M23 family protein [Candidatus Shapirobacteria bacterium GW2011_GWE1_38_10]KKQ64706.1 MAG: Peptidase M23 family protein [Candidatus Shapirobacteria bacterium GW2011_GWF1_38_23]